MNAEIVKTGETPRPWIGRVIDWCLVLFSAYSFDFLVYWFFF
jgi:hypothetical protein